MKSIFFALFLMMAFCSTASAQVCFEWTANTDPIDGYRLYQDTWSSPLSITIAPSDTTVCIDDPIDGLAHRYFLTTYDATQESEMSDTADWYPPRQDPPPIDQRGKKTAGFKLQ